MEKNYKHVKHLLSLKQIVSVEEKKNTIELLTLLNATCQLYSVFKCFSIQNHELMISQKKILRIYSHSEIASYDIRSP